MEDIINIIESHEFSAFGDCLRFDENKRFSLDEYAEIEKSMLEIREPVECAFIDYNHEAPEKVKYAIDALALIVGIDELLEYRELMVDLAKGMFFIASQKIKSANWSDEYGDIIEDLADMIMMGEYNQ